MEKFNNKYRIPSARLQTWDYGANGAYFITICTQNRIHFFGEIVDSPNVGVSTMQLNALGKLAEKYWLEIPYHFPFVELGEFVVMPNHVHGILIINTMGGDDTVKSGMVEMAMVETQNVETGMVETGMVETAMVETQNVETAMVETQMVEMAMVETAMVETGNVEMQNVEMQNVETEMVETAMVETGNVETQNVNTQNVETRLIASLPNQTETNGGFAGNKNPMIHENISRIIRWYKGRCSYELRKIHADFGWQSRFHDHIIRDEQSYQNISHYIINNPAKWAKDTFYG